MDVIIIGGGIAGLSAGCYGQMNGFQTRIFEEQKIVGGCCTAWKRKGYTIDTCIHWLIGSRPPSPFFDFWEEVGAVQGKEMVDHDVYVCVEGSDGREFQIYNDIERLQSRMLELAPEDNKIIKQFIQGIRKCQKIPIAVEKPMELFNYVDIAKTVIGMLPHSLFFRKWAKITLKEFATYFTSPFLREMFGEALLPSFGDNPDLPMIQIMMTFAMMAQKTVCFPIDGSLGLVQSIKDRYESLGGEINCRAKVEKILVQNNKAIGIRLDDRSEHRANIVISAADGYKTIFEMLEGQFISDELKNQYQASPLVKPLVQIALGVDYQFENLPSSVAGYIIPLKEPLYINDQEIKWLLYQIYDFDPSLSPPGKSLVKVVLSSEYRYWKELESNPEEYKKAKAELAQAVIKKLDKKHPGLASRIEMTDVATPVTFERHTGNREGSYMGWLVNPETFESG